MGIFGGRLARKRKRKTLLDIEIRDLKTTLMVLNRYELGSSQPAIRVRELLLERQREAYRLAGELKLHTT
jgi:hypothetical protein